ncbi:geranylgeranyl reductase family protein [Chryseolinea sp. T2]|uniref:NAD(P)/FAD-dependent oxidoreductase n=1 Tax=Chryseolinea sp. T2 TaxID=3129255 RepID=UPI0030776774
MSSRSFDVVIIGAGPAGTAAAIALRASSLSVALIDKATFPRDKICGDALSVDVVRQLKKLSPSLATSLENLPHKTISGGVRIVAPDGEAVDIPFITEHHSEKGYVCRRKDFDMLMISEARRCSNVSIFESCEVNNVLVDENQVRVETTLGPFTAKMIIAADGAHSVVKRKLTTSKINPSYHSAGLRSYHRRVNGFNKGNFIELYFLRDILPGYLWIFPLPGDHANVGIGMLTSAVSSSKVNLGKTFRQLLQSHPALSKRFEHAEAIEAPLGHGLPLGGKVHTLSGHRYILTGDAASLIDPFSGEGIGNAIRSGRFAARQAVECFSKSDFSAKAMSRYDSIMYKMLLNEFKVSRSMLSLSRYPWILNMIVRKANKNESLRKTLINALAFPEKKGWLVNPMFYFNLIFRS